LLTQLEEILAIIQLRFRYLLAQWVCCVEEGWLMEFLWIKLDMSLLLLMSAFKKVKSKCWKYEVVLEVQGLSLKFPLSELKPKWYFFQ